MPKLKVAPLKLSTCSLSKRFNIKPGETILLYLGGLMIGIPTELRPRCKAMNTPLSSSRQVAEKNPSALTETKGIGESDCLFFHPAAVNPKNPAM